MSFLALLTVLVLAAANPYPPVAVPPDWSVYGPNPAPKTLLGWWRRPPRSGESYPTTLQYEAFVGNGQSYDQLVVRLRNSMACGTSGFAQAMKEQGLCGFAVDRDERC